MKTLRLLLCFALIGSSACTFKSKGLPARTPEETVRAFVQLSASARDVSDRKKIQELCQGDLRRTFERMTDEAFTLLYLESKIQITELKVLESSLESDTARIHYSVAVQNDQGTDPTREINEREVDLVYIEGNWYIASIRMKGNDRVAFTRGMIF